MALAVAGDPGAFNELYLRYVKRITSLVGRVLRQSSECEEVTQEVFLQVYLSLPRFEGRSSFYTWIFRVATNVAMHHLRGSIRRYRVEPLDDLMEARLVRPAWLSGSSPERDAEYNALLVETARVVDQLIPNLRDVIILGPVQGHTSKEVASLMGVSTEVIKSRLHRARTIVKDSMWRSEPRAVPHIVAPLPPSLVVPRPYLAP